MYRTTAALVIAATCAFPFAALAGTAADGNDWLSRCQDGTTTGDVAKATYCFSYARGLADGLTIWAVISPTTAPACIPTEVQGRDLVDVGMRYLKDRPEMGGFAAGVPLTQSFVATWPCQQARPTASRPAN